MSLEAHLLHVLTPWRQAPLWTLALSGGLDSLVLLHLLARLARHQALPPLSALHVHHGLQAFADEWAEHCQAACAALDIPLTVCRVTVDSGASVERAAREARYAAFAEHLAPGALLLLAQHRDDQAETLLLRLLRGSGVQGLAAMPASRPLGQGWLLRPLLEVGRAELEQWAQAQGLHWVEDPSNRDTRLARNFLRHEILPRLAQHWPAVSTVLARDAAQQQEAASLLDELAVEDLARAQTPAAPGWLPLPSLALAPLQVLSAARQRNALRYWLRGLTLLPPREHWVGWESLRDAGRDATPCWRLGQGELHRFAGRVWWLGGEWLSAPAMDRQAWPIPEQALSLPGNGTVWLEGAAPGEPLQIRYRQGGEQLVLAGRGRRDLKRLLQEAGVPPFVRERLPLLYASEQLLAVANLPLPIAGSADTLRLCWQPPDAPPLGSARRAKV